MSGNNDILLKDPSFLGRHEVWTVIKELLDQERRSRTYQEQLESRIREGQGACYELHVYCMQMEKRAAEIERSLTLEKSKGKELELRLSSLNSVNGALLHHVVTMEFQAQETRNQPVNADAGGEVRGRESAQQETVREADSDYRCNCKLEEDMQSEPNPFSLCESPVECSCEECTMLPTEQDESSQN